MSYTLPRPSHNWVPLSGKPDFQCSICCCRKGTDVDPGHISTGCTEIPYQWFPGPNFQATTGITWDQLDSSRSRSGAYYEPQSESGPTPVPAAAPTASYTQYGGQLAPATKPDWQGDFEIGDRVMLLGENLAEGEITGFLSARKMIEVLRDDGQEGSGTTVYSMKHRKHVDTWVCDKDELQLLTSGTKIPGEGLSAPKSEHVMGLDPETIDWSKFKKIRDML